MLPLGFGSSQGCGGQKRICAAGIMSAVHTPMVFFGPCHSMNTAPPALFCLRGMT